ncbi:MAG TPA: hypothetical protein VGI60_02310 [Chthoniobacterales bacterium]|jgi:hypothetical protein
MIPQGQQTESATHERKDADVIGLTMVVGLVFVLIALSLLICGGVLHLFNRGQADKNITWQSATRAGEFPGPRLLVHPGSERAENDVAGKSRLETYGWVNRHERIAHIPILRAMALLAERGLPEVGAGQTRLQLMQSRPQSDVQSEKPVTSPAPQKTP